MVGRVGAVGHRVVHGEMGTRGSVTLRRWDFAQRAKGVLYETTVPGSERLGEVDPGDYLAVVGDLAIADG
jgi:hypothetical protein